MPKGENERGLGLTTVRRPQRLADKQNMALKTEKESVNNNYNNIDNMITENTVITNNAPVDISNNINTNTNTNTNNISQAKVNEVQEKRVMTELSEIYSQQEQEEKEKQIHAQTEHEIIRQNKIQAQEELNRLHEQIQVKDNDTDTLWIPVKGAPSNNKVYQVENNLYYRKYTYSDYEDINNTDIPLVDQYTLALDGIKCKALSNILLLPYYDFVYVSIIRRLEAQGTREFQVPYLCNSCGQIGSYKFTLDTIDFSSCDRELPIKARLRSYPDEIFEFQPHTIGDVIFLMREDKYYRKKTDGEYLSDITGSYIPDELSILSCSCVSHSREDAYRLFNEINHKQDHATLKEIKQVLNFGIKPFSFKCDLYLPKEDKDKDVIQKENEEKLKVLGDGERGVSPFLKLLKHMQENKKCEGENIVDILGGDVLILPFRELDDDIKYGILA